MKLENWSVTIGDVDPYQAPEQVTQHLHGNVYGHPNFEDGVPVTTSSIVKVTEGKVLTKSGSLYELGEVDPEYELVYPGAKQRILAQEQQ